MNVFSHFQKLSQELSQKTALVDAHGVLSFQKLVQLSLQYAAVFQGQSIAQGSRIGLLLQPSREFPAVILGLFSLGAIPVLVDPGMGSQNLLRALNEAQISSLVAETKGLLFYRLKRTSFPLIKNLFSLKPKKWIRTTALSQPASQKSEVVELSKEATAAVLFTSGGTGTPKGVVYTHKMFLEQIRLLGEMFQLTPADSDLPGFPLFSLFTMAQGMTSYVAQMNPSKPAQVKPQKLIQQLSQHKITFAAGSPAIWERVGAYAQQKAIFFPDLKSLVLFGAPVSLKLLKLWDALLPQGKVYTPYGATEALPLTLISHQEILTETSKKSLQGEGICVGRAPEGVTLKIYEASDGPEPFFNSRKLLPSLAIGEVIVQGEMVSRKYDQNKVATELSKIPDNDQFWHRMGDRGYLDEQNRLWFCGRGVHVLRTPTQTLYPIMLETIFNQHPQVKRTALVGLGEPGQQIPILIVELLVSTNKKQVLQDLQELQKKHELTIIHDIIFHPSFPVDVRHNIKIDRLKLKAWAERL